MTSCADSVVLGLRPLSLQVVLATGSDLYTSLRNTTGPWPAGATLTLVLAGVDHVAVVDGDLATWQVENTDVADLVDGDTAAIRYTNGAGYNQILARGVVVRA